MNTFDNIKKGDIINVCLAGKHVRTTVVKDVHRGFGLIYAHTWVFDMATGIQIDKRIPDKYLVNIKVLENLYEF